MLDVTVLLLNDNYPSNAIGPIEVFHSAGRLWNLLKGEPRFRVTVASLDGKAVTSPYSVQLLPQVSIDDIKHAEIVIVPSSGLDLDAQFARHAALLPWLRKMAGQKCLIAGCCTGAAYLAEAGLLDGREATTPLGDRRRVPSPLSQGQLAAGKVHHRGSAHAVQRRGLFLDGPQPLPRRKVLRS
jgi:transcriptional regulator GlxA family with amidase domain